MRNDKEQFTYHGKLNYMLQDTVYRAKAAGSHDSSVQQFVGQSRSHLTDFILDFTYRVISQLSAIFVLVDIILSKLGRMRMAGVQYGGLFGLFDN